MIGNRFLWIFLLVANLSIGCIEVAGSQGIPIVRGEVASHLKTESTTSATFGQSDFGQWITDEFGLPAFLYTHRQQEDEPHWFQIGNDSIIAMGYNHGHVAAFSSDWGPKFLNRYDPSGRKYSGGYGYINDGEESWSLFYPDRPEGAAYQRVFGMGYYRKTVVYRNIRAVHTVFAPFGKDRILLSQVELTNTGEQDRKLSYFEYWDVNPHVVAFGKSENQRVSLSKWHAYLSRYRPQYNAVVASRWAWTPSGRPGEIFLTLLDDEVSSYGGNRNKFFGDGTRAKPQQVVEGSLDGSVWTSRTALVLEKEVTLSPGESRTLHFGFGYGKSAKDTAELIARYRDPENHASALSESSREWARTAPVISFPEANWFAREAAWSYYGLRSSISYMEAFDRRTLSQGSTYQYNWGLNAAVRDPIQHVLPMVYLHPGIARDVIETTLALQDPKDFSLPYALRGYGHGEPVVWEPSDAELYLFWLVGEYLFATRDFEWLETQVPYYDSDTTATVYQHLKDAFTRLVDIGVGDKGLIRTLFADADDVWLLRYATLWDVLRGTVKDAQSSVSNGMALYLLPMLQEVAEQQGDPAFAHEVETYTHALRKSFLTNSWTGRWFNRGFLWDGREIGGSDILYLQPNVFALLADVVDDQMQDSILTHLHDRLIAHSPTGALSLHPPDPGEIGLVPQVPGEAVNGGTWFFMTGPLTMALGKVAPELAWNQLVDITLANHSEHYPHIWYGTWSGPDSYNAYYHEKDPGGTWRGVDIDLGPRLDLDMTRWPVQNQQAHAWPLFAAIKLAGIVPSRAGITIDPGLPFDQFSVSTQTFSLDHAPNEVSGRYTSLGDDTIQFRIRLPADLPADQARVELDGRMVSHELSGGFVMFDAALQAGLPVAWRVSGD